MPEKPTCTVAPLSAETWPAFEDLVQRHNGIFGWLLVHLVPPRRA